MGCDDQKGSGPLPKKCPRCKSQREIDGTDIVRTMYGEKLCLECLENWARENFGKQQKKKSKKKVDVIVCPTQQAVDNQEPSKEGKCPKCGSSVVSGYGLAFGGMGAYESCGNPLCRWRWKELDIEKESLERTPPYDWIVKMLSKRRCEKITYNCACWHECSCKPCGTCVVCVAATLHKEMVHGPSA